MIITEKAYKAKEGGSMQKTKRRIEHFSYYDMEGIAEHLRKMAAKGWHLQSITPFYWEYEADTPKRVNYFLTFGTQGVFGYQEEDWTYVTSWQEMEIYRTEDTSVVVPIQDSRTKLKAIQKQMKQSFVPIYTMGIFMALLLLFLPCFAILRDFLTWLPDGVWMLSTLSGVLLFLYTFGRLHQYRKWCKRSKECMYQYGLCAPVLLGQRRRAKLSFFSTLVVLLFYSILLLLRIVPDLHIEFSYVSIFAGILLLAFCGWRIWDKHKQPIRSKVPFQKAYLRVSIVALLVPVLLSGVMYVGEKGEFLPKRAIETVSVKESTGLVSEFYVYDDTLPLSIEDLLGAQEGKYSKRYLMKVSILAAYARCTQMTPPNVSELPKLEYEIWQFRGQKQFENALEYMLSGIDVNDDELQGYQTLLLDGIDMAYQRYYREELCNEFLLVKDKKIVHLLTSWEMTQEQLDTVVSKLFLSETAEASEPSETVEQTEQTDTILHPTE